MGAPALAAAGLLIYSMGCFACRGCPVSFGQGTYLRITWNLEHTRCYRILVFIMGSGPVLFFIICAIIAINNEGYREPLYSAWLSLGVLLLSLKSLMSPSVPVHHDWSSEVFDQIIFKRSCLSMVSQTNDQFCTVLTHALFQAQNGHPLNLEKLLFNPADAKKVIRTCVAVEQDRVSDSTEVGLLDAGEP